MYLVFTSLSVIVGIVAVGAQTYYEPGGAKMVYGQKNPIGGDCWQGELCKQRCLTNANLTRWVASINYVPMCCPFCERSGFYLSNKECRCLHNGPDPKYQPTEEELREVDEFKRRLNGASPSKAMTGALLFVVLSGSMLVHWFS